MGAVTSEMYLKDGAECLGVLSHSCSAPTRVLGLGTYPVMPRSHSWVYAQELLMVCLRNHMGYRGSNPG